VSSLFFAVWLVLTKNPKKVDFSSFAIHLEVDPDCPLLVFSVDFYLILF